MSASASPTRPTCRSSNEETLARIQSLVEWTAEEVAEMNAAHARASDDNQGEDASSYVPEGGGGQLPSFPTPQEAGVEREMLCLCAILIFQVVCN